MRVVVGASRPATLHLVILTTCERINPEVRFGSIMLKNSKIAALGKSRKCSALAISAAARLCKIDTSAGHHFCGI